MLALKRLLKFLHEVGSVGVMGTIAAHIILVVVARREPLAQALALRRGIAALAEWAMVPAVLVVVLSGLLATMINRQLRDAFWVWIKVGLGMPLIHACLGPVRSAAQDTLALATRAAAGHPDPDAMADALYREWAGLWMIIIISLLNIALAIWRPRFKMESDRGGSR